MFLLIVKQITAFYNSLKYTKIFSETNMAYVKKSVQELKAGKDTAHELIEVADE